MSDETDRAFKRAMADAPILTSVTYFGCLALILLIKGSVIAALVVAVVMALRWLGVV